MNPICELLDAMLPGSPHRPHANPIAFAIDRPGRGGRYASLHRVQAGEAA